jgi:hypothetical protein
VVEIFSDISKIKALQEEMHQAKTLLLWGRCLQRWPMKSAIPSGAMGVWAGLQERDLAADDPEERHWGKLLRVIQT